MIATCPAGCLWWVSSSYGTLDLTCVRGWPTAQALRWLFTAADEDPYVEPALIIGGKPGAHCVSWNWHVIEGRYGTVVTALQGGCPHPAEVVRTNESVGPYGVADYDSYSPGMHFWWMRVAYWIIAAASGVLPAARLAGMTVGTLNRRRRFRRGRCSFCGYDLRATPARCPECGSVPRTNSKT
ncbi:MAG TPA: hypothetical protein VFC78_09570 [Tepidisphaeraceae bacterium]|nr:hypothetical protein [Tepidisphaeraceae bacterium]